MKWNITSPEEFFKGVNLTSFKIDQGIVKARNLKSFLWLEILPELIEFEDGIDKAILMESIKKSLIECINKKKFESTLFIDELNRIVKPLHTSHYEEKILLTTITIKITETIKNLNFFDCDINIYKPDLTSLPKEFLFIHEQMIFNDLPTNENYSIIAIKTKSRSNSIEYHIRNLNIFRAILCALSIYYIRVDNSSDPINQIRLGKSLLLNQKHEIISIFRHDEFNYFPPHNIHTFSRFDKVYEIINQIQNIKQDKYRSIVKESLLLYVNALDDYHSTTALTLLWNSLDKLSNSSKGNYDQVLKRVAAISEKPSYDKIILEHIKNIRNQYVHNGVENKKSNFFCYLLQFYYVELLNFHLQNSNSFESIEDAYKCLTYLSKTNEIKEDQKQFNTLNFIKKKNYVNLFELGS